MKKLIISLSLLFVAFLPVIAQESTATDNWKYIPHAIMDTTKTISEGLRHHKVLMCGPARDDNSIFVKDTIQLYDLYCVYGKKTQCIGIVDCVEPVRVVIQINKKELKERDFITDNLVKDFLIQHGWSESENFHMAFLSDQKPFISSIAKQTSPKIFDIVGHLTCVGYDFHSGNASFMGNSTFMVDLLEKDAKQEFIDKQAKKAKYTKSTKEADLRRLFNEKDPATIEFVSKYLTWAGKWNKNAKNLLMNKSY